MVHVQLPVLHKRGWWPTLDEFNSKKRHCNCKIRKFPKKRKISWWPQDWQPYQNAFITESSFTCHSHAHYIYFRFLVAAFLRNFCFLATKKKKKKNKKICIFVFMTFLLHCLKLLCHFPYFLFPSLFFNVTLWDFFYSGTPCMMTKSSWPDLTNKKKLDQKLFLCFWRRNSINCRLPSSFLYSITNSMSKSLDKRGSYSTSHRSLNCWWCWQFCRQI